MARGLDLTYDKITVPNGITLFELAEKNSGFTLTSTHGNPDRRTAAFKGWIAARQSRAAGSPRDIAVEMGEKGVSPDKKLDVTYKGYGHGSVADGARIDVHFNGVPMIIPFTLFNRGYINSGQEKSTRYQTEFSDKPLHGAEFYLPADMDLATLNNINEKYQKIGKTQLDAFSSFLESVKERYEGFYGTPKNRAQKGAFTSRSLDTARFMLLMGQNTGFAFETSARDWERHIAFAKGHDMHIFQRTGYLLNQLLAPDNFIENEFGLQAEAPTLIKYTKPNRTTVNLLNELKSIEIEKYSHPSTRKLPNKQKTKVYDDNAQEKAMENFLMAVNPALASQKKIQKYVNQLSRAERAQLSEQVYSAYTHHDELPSLARTTGLTASLETQLGEIRDWNRHKSVGRFIHGIPAMYGLGLDKSMAHDMIQNGYGIPSYLAIEAMSTLADVYNTHMNKHYEAVHSFMETLRQEVGTDADYSIMQNLLPLGHTARIDMHMTPQDISYITKLRVRPGGHINYREQAFDIAEKFAKHDPFLSGLALKDDKPDAASPEQFYNRS